jgi:hypothetical protein
MRREGLGFRTRVSIRRSQCSNGILSQCHMTKHFLRENSRAHPPNLGVKKLLFLGWCLLVMNHAALGTTVIALRNASTIVIGSDSRENDGVHALPNPVCKILTPDGRRFWASSQVYKEPAANFDIEAVVNRASTDASSVQEWVSAFDQRIVAELERMVRVVQRDSPESYRKIYQGKHILEILFVGFESNVPILCYRDYQTDIRGRLMKPTTFNCPSAECGSVPHYFCLGDCSEIAELTKHDEALLRGEPSPEIKRLIRIEIDAHWQDGPPIDILQIDRLGPRWTDKEPESKCQPIRP